MERKICAINIVFVIVVVLLLHQFSTYEKPLGYKPADNAQGYKEWCKETFGKEEGAFIYEAYREIAFEVEYTPEPPKTDFWQTPKETIRLRRGDCEDAVFLFFSQLPSNQENAEIVWGWVIDKRSNIGKAHVWYQLLDKRGQKYIVESFSKDWNGIIPIEIVEETESRKPMLTISHYEAASLCDSVAGPDSSIIYGLLAILHGSTDKSINSHDVDTCITMYSEHRLNGEFAEYYTNNQLANVRIGKEVRNIYKKLLEMFTRYYREKKANG